MAGVFEFVTGERVVVSIFVLRLLLFCSSFLHLEAAALALLAASALAVEISAEKPRALNRYKTRPGASSGIFLGAVTLPAAILSRCISVSRLILDNGVGSRVGETELWHMHTEYWVVSASCFGVLILLGFQKSRASTRLSIWTSKASIFCPFGLVLFLLVGFLSFKAKSNSGWQALANLVWLLCHGLANVELIQYVLHKFPSCASLGEVTLVSSGLILYIGDMLGSAVLNISRRLSLHTEFLFAEYGNRCEIFIILQGVFLGLLVFPTVHKGICQICSQFAKNVNSEKNGQTRDELKSREIGSSLLFYISLAFMVCVIVPLWLQFFQGFHVHPLKWVIIFLFSDYDTKMSLCAYWAAVIFGSVITFYNISKHSRIKRILLRKYYHLAAVIMFVPALFLQPSFLDLAFGVALAVFVVLEMIRVWRIWPFGHHVHQFMNAFTDHRDSEILIVSHFSLLLGCALPKWMSYGLDDRPLAPYAGILSLGIGDTMASVVGHKYGILRWCKHGKKTIEGTAAGITSVLASCSLLLGLLASTGYILSQQWLSLVMSVILSGLLEAYTTQLDNAFIPLVFFSLLCL